MRLTTTRLAVPLILLALAGCGGEQVVVNNVPGGPVDLKVPGTGEGLRGAAKQTPTPAASETPTGEADASQTPAGGTTNSAPTDQGTQQPAPATGTGETPDTGAGDGTGGGAAPNPGASKEEFEDYCAQNPGAC